MLKIIGLSFWYIWNIFQLLTNSYVLVTRLSAKHARTCMNKSLPSCVSNIVDLWNESSNNIEQVPSWDRLYMHGVLQNIGTLIRLLVFFFPRTEALCSVILKIWLRVFCSLILKLYILLIVWYSPGLNCSVWNCYWIVACPTSFFLTVVQW